MLHAYRLTRVDYIMMLVRYFVDELFIVVETSQRRQTVITTNQSIGQSGFLLRPKSKLVCMKCPGAVQMADC